MRQNSDESRHNHTVPLIPTTCLDNVSPPPLPPRSIDRRNLSPPINPLAKPKPTSSKPYKPFPMHQSMPPYQDQRLRSSHSLDSDLEGPQPNSIALQMSYPLVNVPPPPLQVCEGVVWRLLSWLIYSAYAAIFRHNRWQLIFGTDLWSVIWKVKEKIGVSVATCS